jgi:hypothetical protein
MNDAGRFIAAAGCICAACAARSGQADSQSDHDAIVAAAFDYLTAPRQADSTSAQLLCFSIRPEDTFERPPRGSEVDPPGSVMRALRERFPTATPASECPPKDWSFPAPGRRINYDRPMFYMVGTVTVEAPTRAVVGLGHFFHGLHQAVSVARPRERT